MGDRVRVQFPLFRYVTNQPPKANSAFYPSRVGKWVPASAGKAKAGMVHSVSGRTWGVQVKLWDPLRTSAIPERLRGVITTRRYTNPRLPHLLDQRDLSNQQFVQRRHLSTLCILPFERSDETTCNVKFPWNTRAVLATNDSYRLTIIKVYTFQSHHEVVTSQAAIMSNIIDHIVTPTSGSTTE